MSEEERLTAVGAARLETRVPGLAVERARRRPVWRLVHAPTGRVLSRSAEHADPALLHDLASRVADLAPWVESELSVPGPRLRADLTRVIGEWRHDHGLDHRAAPPSEPTGRTPAVPVSPSRWTPAAPTDLEALRRLVRHLYEAVPPGRLGATVRDLALADRDVLLGLVTATDDGDITGVVQAIRPVTEPTAVVPPADPDDGHPRRGARGPGRAAG
jgi:hypothetical protein